MNTLEQCRKPRIITIRKRDPFDHFSAPSNATGLVVAHQGFDITRCLTKEGWEYHVIRLVKNSADCYERNYGHYTGVSRSFYDTKWPVSSRSEAMMMIYRLIRARLRGYDAYSKKA
ncbi:hypothetical protein D3C87_465840 [compost metagenome]